MREKKYGDWTDTDNESFHKVPYLELFLNRYSESTKRKAYYALIHYALYCNKVFRKNILDMKGLEIVKYCEQVNDRKKKRTSEGPVQISKASKRNIRNYISAYYKYVKDVKALEQESFENPMPSLKVYDFDENESLDLDALESKEQLLSIKTIQSVLSFFFYRNYNERDLALEASRMFIVGCLIAFTGARVHEISQIKLRNLDVKNRWFITGVKSPKKSKRNGIYFFPEFFQSFLEHYLQLLKRILPDATYLFETKKGAPIAIRTIQEQFKNARKKLGLEAMTNPHAFRDFLNTKRFEKGCKKSLRKFLLNQKAGDVNPDNYLKKYKNRIHLRRIYDKYNPFDKSIMPEKLRF